MGLPYCDIFILNPVMKCRQNIKSLLLCIVLTITSGCDGEQCQTLTFNGPRLVSHKSQIIVFEKSIDSEIYATGIWAFDIIDEQGHVIFMYRNDGNTLETFIKNNCSTLQILKDRAIFTLEENNSDMNLYFSTIIATFPPTQDSGIDFIQSSGKTVQKEYPTLRDAVAR